MGGVTTITNYLFLAAAVHVLLLDAVSARSHDGDPKLRATIEACKVTEHHELCVRTLAPFSEGSHSTPYLWARAGVVVTIWEVGTLHRYILQVKKSGKAKDRRLVAAIDDCIEIIDDAKDQLQDSLRLLRNLDPTKFKEQMNDLNTWLSAALTDEDTCIEGINEGGGQVILGEVESKVANSSMLISNALALATKLASSGFPSR